jgi:hypothetical protein
VLTPERMVVPARAVKAPLTVARRPVQSMVALTVVPVAWAATAKVWLMAGPRRARAMAEPMVEQTAALVAEGSSGSW